MHNRFISSILKFFRDALFRPLGTLGCAAVAAGVFLLPMAAAAAEAVAVVVMNEQPREDLALDAGADGTWSFRYARDLQADPAAWLAQDTPRTDMRWQNWDAPEKAWMNGIYGTHLTFQVEFPYAVTAVQAGAVVANHADTLAREACLEYSLDGLDFLLLAEARYAGTGGQELGGRADILQPGANRLWLRLRQRTPDAATVQGGIVFKQFSFTVSGPVRQLTPDEVATARTRIEDARRQRLDQAERARFAALLAHLEGLTSPGAAYRVGVVSSMVTVFPGEPPRPEQMAGEVSLAVARREHESAQIVVCAGAEPIAVERVEATDLRRNGGEERIGAEQVEVRLVGYVYLEQSSWRGIPRLGLWPDPLLRFRPFVCPPWQARCLWVTVRAPAEAVAGDYAGAVRLLAGGRTVAEVPVRLRLHPFVLPEAPHLHTSYWNEFGSAYDPRRDEAVLAAMIRLFGQYRVSTNVAQPADVVWYREADGTITADWARLRQRLELAIASGFRTLNIGPGLQGNWGDGVILAGISRGVVCPVLDRATGRPVDAEAARQVTPLARARAYLVPLADWLQEKGLLERAYLQIADEEIEPANWRPLFLPLVETLRAAEPRIRLLSVLGLHPSHQGWFDIASPLFHFYDGDTYRMVREGVSLYGPKSFAGRVSASSTGGWGGSSFYRYQPVDAYDGCRYTKWIPQEPATPDRPQWLRFDFDAPAPLDGLHLEPYGPLDQGTAWTAEGSTDGETFVPLRLAPRGDGEAGNWSFEPGLYRAIRLVWTSGRRPFVATEAQPLPPQEPLTVGVREVEFLQEGLPREATRLRQRVRPVTMWEYQIGPNYPSVSIDADPAEVRANPWRCWAHGVAGYLNWGAFQFEGQPHPRPRTEDPLVWPDLNGPSGAMIVYPGRDEVLPSIRFARFRDGVDDVDYLNLLEDQQPAHPLLAQIRSLGGNAYSSGAVIEANRRALVEALSRQ